ncbi:MAG: HlyD family type I secretion periplasmic adaptor subunit [Aurantimonas endophytica]|uniref:HlyD family type I secretion periplasmic adaptor subunit n=1 Tax=Aurantimonas endophytica TaxID=1522175 RepID=UPI0030036849
MGRVLSRETSGTARRPSSDSPEFSTKWKPIAQLGLAAIVLTFGVFGAWAAVSRLDSAAVASGIVSTAGNIKSVQHLEGGIIKEIRVQNGSRVEAGDILVRLDTTQSEASALLFRRQLAAARASVARLEAEDSLADELSFPVNALEDRDDPFIRQALAAETARFRVGRDSLNQQIKIIKNQNDQVLAEIASNEAVHAAAEEEYAIVNQRLNDLRRLAEQSLVERSTVLEIERDALNLRTKVATAESDIIRSRQRMAENELKIVQIRQEYRQIAANNIPELRRQIRELERQVVVAEDMLRRVEVVAPVSGIVQEMSVFTVGAVIQPGENLMNISPDTDDLVIEARVAPLDADSIDMGMRAEIRFPAFAYMNLLPVYGSVVSRSGDRIIDQVTNDSYFSVQVKVDGDNIPEILRDRLGAGLPANVVIPTGERTALAYLIDPLTSRFNNAMRER